MSAPLRPWADFDALVRGIRDVDRAAVLAAGRQAHQLLSQRNWLVGTWIVTFEQDGRDRAAYGTRLLVRLAAALETEGRTGMSARNLANFRSVALAYPALDVRALGQAALAGAVDPEILQTPAQSASPIAELPWRDAGWVLRLFRELTFSHLLEFARIEDPLERGFYELHCLKEGWATRGTPKHSGAFSPARADLSERAR